MTTLIALHEAPPADKLASDPDLQPNAFAVRADRIQHVIDMEAQVSGVVDLAKLAASPSRFALIALIGDPRPIKLVETYSEVIALLSDAGIDLVTARPAAPALEA